MGLYEEEYQIRYHDARFDLARGISRSAKNVESAKEPRWSTIVKNEIFGKLIQSARVAEGIRVCDAMGLMERLRMSVFPFPLSNPSPSLAYFPIERTRILGNMATRLYKEPLLAGRLFLLPPEQISMLLCQYLSVPQTAWDSIETLVFRTSVKVGWVVWKPRLAGS